MVIFCKVMVYLNFNKKFEVVFVNFWVFILLILFCPFSVLYVGKTRFLAMKILLGLRGTTFFVSGVTQTSPKLGYSGFKWFPSVWLLSRLGSWVQKSAILRFLPLSWEKCLSKSFLTKSFEVGLFNPRTSDPGGRFQKIPTRPSYS